MLEGHPLCSGLHSISEYPVLDGGKRLNRVRAVNGLRARPTYVTLSEPDGFAIGEDMTEIRFGALDRTRVLLFLNTWREPIRALEPSRNPFL